MVKVINELSVCQDCLQAIANDDYSGLDYAYGTIEAEEVKDRIVSGIEAWSKHGHLVAAGDDYGFCRTPCDVCGDPLDGDRYAVAVLK